MTDLCRVHSCNQPGGGILVKGLTDACFNDMMGRIVCIQFQPGAYGITGLDTCHGIVPFFGIFSIARSLYVHRLRCSSLQRIWNSIPKLCIGKGSEDLIINGNGIRSALKIVKSQNCSLFLLCCIKKFKILFFLIDLSVRCRMICKDGDIAVFGIGKGCKGEHPSEDLPNAIKFLGVPQITHSTAVNRRIIAHGTGGLLKGYIQCVKPVGMSSQITIRISVYRQCP